jgi:hypothetical protein
LLRGQLYGDNNPTLLSGGRKVQVQAHPVFSDFVLMSAEVKEIGHDNPIAKFMEAVKVASSSESSGFPRVVAMLVISLGFMYTLYLGLVFLPWSDILVCSLAIVSHLGFPLRSEVPPYSISIQGGLIKVLVSSKFVFSFSGPQRFLDHSNRRHCIRNVKTHLGCRQFTLPLGCWICQVPLDCFCSPGQGLYTRVPRASISPTRLFIMH